ncbi:MAG: sigma 54-interacting transcriptional regulator [Blastocatellia bacterium]|nr:sigma 54-interacting transcriptional regulator [Blastocatellia bacterium]
MNTNELKLIDLLQIDEKTGTIYLNDRRFLLFDADAMGLLRKELIEDLELERARRILSRFSYARGYRDAHHLRNLFNWKTESEWAMAGREIHAFEGFAYPYLKNMIIDREKGIFQVDGEWRNSYEAEQHLRHIGNSDVPVCWMLTGYAAGYMSAVMGRRVVYIEKECVAKGDSVCSFHGQIVDENNSEIEALLKNYQEETFHSEIQTLLNKLEEQTQKLQQQRERVRKLEQEIDYLQEALKEENNFEEMVGMSQVFREVIRNVERVASSSSTVLLCGETGTGKEILARAIHARSSRKNRPMVAINCAALPTGLVESELFGHERGAFTGADKRKLGRFEVADGATIFLDEVGELPLETQAKLLRVLQLGEFERLGSTQTIRVDVRVIAATNQPLEKLVAEGKYRADLFYRLNVFPINIPPLRERGEDVTLLTYYFAQKFNTRMKKRITSIDEGSLERLKRYYFPGNIRELEHIVERAVLLCDTDTLKIDLPIVDQVETKLNGHSVLSSQILLLEELLSLEEVERRYLQEVLRRTSGQVEGKGGAAEILELPPSTLRSKLKKLKKR